MVDDEPMVLEFVGTVLDQEGYCVIRAGNPVDALAWAAAQSVAPDLLLTDVTMPVLNGPSLARALQRACPTTVVLFMTGVDVENALSPDADLLRKPFQVPELLERVRRALKFRRSAVA